MDLRREIGFGGGSILVVQLLLSLLAIALLLRMGPAIERIRQENVFSAEAVETMLARLAVDRTDDAATALAWQEFTAALARAEQNITEASERPVLADIRVLSQRGFDGAPGARAQLVTRLQELGEINRHSMQVADAEAQRLGRAGAWGAAILGALALLVGTFIYRRILTRIAIPLDEVCRTTQDVRIGNHHRRCVPSESPAEIQIIAANLNWLLDQLNERDEMGAPHRGRTETELRAALTATLDQLQTPACVIDATGKRVAMSLSMLNAPEGTEPLETIPVAGTGFHLGLLRGPATASDSAD